MIGNKNKIINWILEKNDTEIFEIKKYIKKRTLKSNAYYYSLLNQLSTKLKIPSEELHFEYIKRSSPFIEVLIPIEADSRVFEYYEIKKYIEKDNKQFKIVKIYTASHLLNTVEMGMLLDNLIEDCKDNGISTMTPEELSKMRSLEKSVK